MTVTAIIPTTGRASVRRSVEAALSQTPISDVLVVADGRTAGSQAEAILSESNSSSDTRLHLTVAPNAGNGSKVRNFGTQLATTPFVAYCDDDDIWLQEKVTQQLEAIGQESAAFSSHAYWRISPQSSRVMPNKPRDTDDLGTLLLTRDSLSYRRGFCATTSLLVPTHVAKTVLWDEALRRHQDWDFVLRLQRDAKLKWTFLTSPLAMIDATTPSVSRRVTDADPAQYFLSKHEQFLPRRVAADFSVVHIAGPYFRSGDYVGGTHALREAFASYGRPNYAALSLALLRTVQHYRDDK